jgi:hypothetical protein
LNLSRNIKMLQMYSSNKIGYMYATVQQSEIQQIISNFKIYTPWLIKKCKKKKKKSGKRGDNLIQKYCKVKTDAVFYLSCGIQYHPLLKEYFTPTVLFYYSKMIILTFKKQKNNTTTLNWTKAIFFFKRICYKNILSYQCYLLSCSFLSSCFFWSRSCLAKLAMLNFRYFSAF